MPREYNFDQLSPREFEFLGRDLVQKKIRGEGNSSFFFKSFSEGQDDGIDAIFQDDTNKIVLQCKRYRNFDQLFTTLKNSELPKVKKLKPSRYLLCVSCQLGEKQTQKIFDLLHDYIHAMTDIVDGLMLNNLLDEFPEVELNYPKLYLNSVTTLGYILHADVYNQSSFKLNQFRRLANYFVAGSSFRDALNILVKQRYLIISGEPGVGKSTMAGMFGLYFAEQGYEFVFVRKRITEATGAVWKKDQKQIFFFDDFLGSTTFEGFDRNEDRELLDFIRNCVNGIDKLLVVTTREYVFRQAELKYPELKELNYHKCFIRQKEFTSGFKINILYNYLYYSKVEWHHIEPLLYDENYKRLIHHNNFTPRLLSEYIDKYYDSKGPRYSFFLGFKKYLDDPYAYWEGIFKKLSDVSQMLMLIIGITAEPALEWIIFETFRCTGKYRDLYKKGYEQDSFNDALAELSGSFISILHNPPIDRKEGTISSRDLSLMTMTFSWARYIEFQNPSIKDFTITYLRKREDLQSILINSAVVFNQLYFAFATSNDKERLEDEEFEYNYTARKILLTPKLQTELANKTLKEFDELPIAKVRKISWTGGIDSFHLNEDAFSNRMLKLWELCMLFPLAEYSLVKEFVIQRYQQILEEEREYLSLEMKVQVNSLLAPLSLDERMYQVDIIKRIAPYIKLDPEKTVADYYKNIRFAREFLMLESLKDIFPDAYHKTITANLVTIRREIREMLIDDIDYYLSEGTHEAEEALDHLIDMELEQLEEAYKIKLSTSWKKRVNDMVGYDLFRLEKQIDRPRLIDPDEHTDHYVDVAKEEEQIYKSYQSALTRLRPQWAINMYERPQMDYLKSLSTQQKIDTKLIRRIRQFANKYDSDLLYWPSTVEMLYSFFTQQVIKPHKLENFYEYILFASKLSRDLLAILAKTAFEFTLVATDTFRKSTFIDKVYECSNESIKDKIIDELLSCVLVRSDDIWHSFFSVDFQCYLAARSITNLTVHEKKLFYNSFDKLHCEVSHVFMSPLWKYCNQFDEKEFLNYFIIPVLKSELEKYSSKLPEKRVMDFLVKYDFEFSYEYWEDESRYMLDSGSGGDVLIDKIMDHMDVGELKMFEILEFCLNISDTSDSMLQDYVNRYCFLEGKTYEININKELSSDHNFISVLYSCGVITAVNNYFNWLQSHCV